jgi:hypothetical protein
LRAYALDVPINATIIIATKVRIRLSQKNQKDWLAAKLKSRAFLQATSIRVRPILINAWIANSRAANHKVPFKAKNKSQGNGRHGPGFLRRLLIGALQ